jgi:hypothetical protein
MENNNMSDLTAFLKQNIIEVENIKYVASKRILDKEGKPEKWELRAITSKEDDDIIKSCTKRVPVPGKKGQFMAETDQTKYVAEMCAKSIIYPNLNDKVVQDSFGVMCATDLLKEMLTPGEYTELSKKITELNGYDMSFEEKVEEAKN